jgi:predicted exporter
LASVELHAVFRAWRPAAADPQRIVTSVLFCNLATVVGFGCWALPARVLSAIGTTVAIGAVLSMVFAAILTTFRRFPTTRTALISRST